MKKQDKNFDFLLHNLFEESQAKIPKDDFVNELMATLPVRKRFSYLRLFILSASLIFALLVIFLLGPNIISSTFTQEVLSPLLFDNYASVVIILLLFITFYGFSRPSESDLGY